MNLFDLCNCFISAFVLIVLFNFLYIYIYIYIYISFFIISHLQCIDIIVYCF